VLVVNAHLRLARIEPIDKRRWLSDDPASRRFCRAAIASAESSGGRDQAPAIG
jgi:hypothetical protein